MRGLLDIRRKKRILFLFGFICVLLASLTVKLVYIQGYKSVEYSNKQSLMLTQRLPIKAKRGDIYDRNMNVLAKDSTSSRIYVRPVDIKKDKRKEIATYLSKQLKLKYKDVYKKVADSDSNYVLIASKVDNNIGFNIKKKDYNGVEVTEDQKRYYTNSNFASHVLGFTGDDHQGLYGIEASYDNALSGKDGVTIYQTDGSGRKIPSGTKVREEPKDGNNLVLSLDSAIQMYTEDAVRKGKKKTGSKRVMAVAIDPKTGEVLAMASNPSYNLNDPWTLDSDFVKEFSGDFTTTGKKGKKRKMNKEEKLYKMWENPLINYNYEPGSTFKAVTVSSALEEGSITTKNRFYCSGSRTINGTKIRCHIYPNAHGSESLSDSLANSCNPAMMEISLRMGPDTFYKYIYDYGFGSKTGITLSGEESGIIPPNEDVNAVDFVTKSFGQGIAVTPIQMTMGFSAVINGGYLLKPQIVKEETTGVDNETVNTYGKSVVRQVISKDTSKTMRKYLRNVVTKSQTLKKLDTKSLKMGGKTGTAQKIVNGKYSNSKYVCSYIGFAPYNDPKIAVLVICDEPYGDTTGSASAAPIASEILKNSMNYLNLKESDNKTTAQNKKVKTGKIIIPDLRGYKLTEGRELLDALNIKYEVKYKGKKNKNGTIINQTNIQEEYNKKKTVTLTIGEAEEDKKATVPNVKGLSVQGANKALKNAGFNIEVKGGGIAYKQSIKAGTKVEKGTTIKVYFKYVE